MFENKDLLMMMSECVIEVEKLKYEVNPILSVKFTKGRKNTLAYLKLDSKCSYNPYGNQYDDVQYRMCVNEIFENLSDDYYQDLKTLIMHEVVHAIKIDPSRKNYPHPYLLHSELYDEITKEIENVYGYRDINSKEKDINKLPRLSKYFIQHV